MLELSLEQMKRLAVAATGEDWEVTGDEVTLHLKGDDRYGNEDNWIYWMPDINGDDWQLAQACKVIVAALKLGRESSIRQKDGWYECSYRKGHVCNGAWVHQDLLHASALALLGDKT